MGRYLLSQVDLCLLCMTHILLQILLLLLKTYRTNYVNTIRRNHLKAEGAITKRYQTV